MNTVEWAIRDGVSYAIDFMNPAPDMDVNSLTPPYFDWVVHRMADLVIDRALNPRPQSRLRDWEDELLAVDPAYRDPSPTSRFDSFFASDDELLFTEFNTETPAGAAYSDALAEAFYGLPVFQEFQRRFRVFPIPAK